MSNIEILSTLPEDLANLFLTPDYDPSLERQLTQLQAQDPIAYRDIQLGILYRTITALQFAFLNSFGTCVVPEVNAVLAQTNQLIKERMTRQHFHNLMSYPLIEL